jgi:hypothetical protein
MDKKLQLLDSFPAQGTDGASYKVMAYEHLRRVDLLADGQDRWEPTGVTEYRLASGERVEVAREGLMRVVPTGVELRPAGSGSRADATKRPTATAEARR